MKKNRAIVFAAADRPSVDKRTKVVVRPKASNVRTSRRVISSRTATEAEIKLGDAVRPQA